MGVLVNFPSPEDRNIAEAANDNVELNRVRIENVQMDHFSRILNCLASTPRDMVLGENFVEFGMDSTDSLNVVGRYRKAVDQFDLPEISISFFYSDHKPKRKRKKRN